MSLPRTLPIPPWCPNQVMEELAHGDGKTVAEFRAELRAAAAMAAEPGHLGFEQLTVNEFTEEDRRHLNGCEFCKDLFEALFQSTSI